MTAEKNVIYGPPLESSIDASLGELLLTMLRIHNETVLQIDAETGDELLACQVLNRAIEVAKWLQKNGIRPGDSVSISSENRLEYCIVVAACFIAGITLAPINPDYTLAEFKHVIKLSKPKIVFCSRKTISFFISEWKNYTYVQTIVLLDRKQYSTSNVAFYEDIIKDAKADGIDEEYEATAIDKKETVAFTLCSSGTTGLPKGVMLTQFNITSYLEIATKIYENNLGVSVDGHVEVMTGLVPFFHGMGLMVVVMAMIAGRTVVVYPKFCPKLFLESIAKYKVTTVVLPPTLVHFLVSHPLVGEYDLSNIRELRCGSAALGSTLEREAIKKLNLKLSAQTYGMTEMTLGVLTPYGDKHKPGSVGRVAPTMACKVIDEKGQALGPNRKGELCFKGPLIMKGYIGNPKATADIIDEEGWLHTGDIAYYDENGLFFFVDRLKELIKYKGFQVAPAELEALLLTHPDVADAAVVGIPCEMAGELPLAFVVRKHVNVTSSELEKYVQKRVSSSKWLRGGVHFIEAIPRNPAGKVLRRLLRERTMMMKSSKL